MGYRTAPWPTSTGAPLLRRTRICASATLARSKGKHLHAKSKPSMPEVAQRWRKRDPHFAPEGGESLTAMLSERIIATVHTFGGAATPVVWW
jgi:probable phosphoglycerate mutase